MSVSRPFVLPAVVIVTGLLVLAPSTFVASSLALPAEDSDGRAVEIARQVMERMGGQENWDRTRYISWTFFGRNTHYWDKWTGNHRIESEKRLVLMNINTLEGRVWEDGQEINDPDALQQELGRGHRTWVNDSYWLLMPYKLLDPGVTLKYKGEDQIAGGRNADVLELTFENVGYTPQNRYLVYVARDTELVEQWLYFENASDEEPGFTLPWTRWRRFGNVMLSTDRGRGFDWKIAVYDELPASVFTSPDPVNLLR